MKKTYISPEALTVSLTMCNIIALSGDPEGKPEDLKDDLSDQGAEVLTKGYKNVWDTEW